MPPVPTGEGGADPRRVRQDEGEGHRHDLPGGAGAGPGTAPGVFRYRNNSPSFVIFKHLTQYSDAIAMQ